MPRPPRTLSASRAWAFCQALELERAGRPPPWWISIAKVARRLQLPYDQAVLLADDCARAGYVVHDQSAHTHAGRRAAELPHSVCLVGPGWTLVDRRRRVSAN
jgi:hypothetical protein